MHWNFIIHQIFSEFLQPLRDFRITTRVSLCSLLSLLFIWFWFFIGLDQYQVALICSSTVVRHSYWRDVTVQLRSSRSRVLVSLTVGDEDELEEDGEQ